MPGVNTSGTKTTEKLGSHRLLHHVQIMHIKLCFKYRVPSLSYTHCTEHCPEADRNYKRVWGVLYPVQHNTSSMGYILVTECLHSKALRSTQCRQLQLLKYKQSILFLQCRYGVCHDRFGLVRNCWWHVASHLHNTTD